MIATTVFLLLLAPGITEEDRLGRVAFFQFQTRPVYVAACSGVLPEHAAAFERRQAQWLRDNDAAIKRGIESLREEVGAQFSDAPLPIEEARDGIAAIIRKLPPEERLAWCEEKLPQE